MTYQRRWGERGPETAEESEERRRSGRRWLWVLGAVVLVVAFVLRTFASTDVVRGTYAATILLLGVLCLAAAVVAVTRRVDDARAWGAYGLGLGLSLLAGGIDTLLLGDTRAGYLVVLLAGVPLVAWAVPSLLGLRHARREDLLDSALVAVSATFWAWELRFQPGPDETFELSSLVPLGFVCFVFAVATLALLTGRGGHINRVRWMMALGFSLEAVAIIVSPDSLTGGRYAGDAVGTGLMLAGGIALVGVVWVAASGYRPDVDREPMTLRWWAPMTVTISSYVVHTLVRRFRPEAGVDVVEVALVCMAGLALTTRIVGMVRHERLLNQHLGMDRERLRTLLHDVQDQILIVDREFVVTRHVGRAEDDGPSAIVGTCLLDTVHPEEVAGMHAAMARAARQPGVSETQELRLRFGDVVRWIEGTMVDRFDDPTVGGLVVTFRDITDRRLAQEDLRRRAMYDQLTGLASRETLKAVAAELLPAASRGCPVSLLYCDLDRLKVVNDSLGHHVGDDVISAVADRWSALLPTRATLSRFGGDEFVVCYPHERGRRDAMEFAEALLRDLRTPLRIADHELTVSASIGVTTIESPDVTIDEALRDADAALYVAKAAGRNQIKEFDPAMRRVALERLHLEQELRQALRGGGVEVHLQPIVDLSTGMPESFEALVRWHTEERGWVPAQTIISLAEETGLIVPLGELVLDMACEAIARIRRMTGSPIRVAVNTSALQLLRPDFGDMVRITLQRHQLPSDALVLEVTESILLDEEGLARGTLRDLHVQGVSISLDDFGTGYSSLSYLGTFPLDQLKLDRTLVTGTAETATGAAVLAGVIRITQNLGLPVVAEGLENLADVHRLRGLGATLGQGWHYARAMTPDDALAWALGRLLGDASAERVTRSSE